MSARAERLGRSACGCDERRATPHIRRNPSLQIGCCGSSPDRFSETHLYPHGPTVHATRPCHIAEVSVWRDGWHGCLGRRMRGMSFGRLGALCSTLALLCAAVLPALAEDLPRVRAVYVETGPVIDGVLDDAVWEKAGVIDEFVQVVPVPGATPSQRTEVRLLRDAENLYVAIRAYEDSPAQIVAHRLERDDFFFFDEAFRGLGDWLSGLADAPEDFFFEAFFVAPDARG